MDTKMNEVFNIFGENLTLGWGGGAMDRWFRKYFYGVKNYVVFIFTILVKWKLHTLLVFVYFLVFWTLIQNLSFEKMISPTQHSSLTCSMGVTQGRKWPTHWSTFHFRLSLFTAGPSFSLVLPVHLPRISEILDNQLILAVHQE